MWITPEIIDQIYSSEGLYSESCLSQGTRPKKEQQEITKKSQQPSPQAVSKKKNGS